MLKAGQHGVILDRLRERIYSKSASFCLRRDLTQPFEAPESKISITVRPHQPGEATVLFDASAPGLSGTEISDRVARMDLFQAGIPTCYVAIDLYGTPCYAQWLMTSADNDRIQKFFRGTFPILLPDQALLEGAFTSGGHRGLGIMSRAMALIAERAGDFGARYVITFVGEENLPSLKGCKRAGFEPHMLRKTGWQFLRPWATFQALSEGAPYPLDKDEGKSKAN